GDAAADRPDRGAGPGVVGGGVLPGEHEERPRLPVRERGHPDAQPPPAGRGAPERFVAREALPPDAECLPGAGRPLDGDDVLLPHAGAARGGPRRRLALWLRAVAGLSLRQRHAARAARRGLDRVRQDFLSTASGGTGGVLTS